MAHNIMRVDSMNNRYVTETMLDLNLDLNEEIDFDFFDNAETPSKEPLTKKEDILSISSSRPCSPEDLEDDDDDDVQISPHHSDYNMRATRSVKDINSSLDSTEEPLSKGTENEEKYIDNFDKNETSGNTDDISTETLGNMSLNKVVLPESSIVMKENVEPSFSQCEKSCKETLCKISNKDEEDDGSLKSQDDHSLPSRVDEYERETALSRKSSLSQASMKSNENLDDDTSSLNQVERASTKSSENNNEHTSSKYSESQKADGSGSGYDSDEGCHFEGSDDELLLGVHTLTIVPRENDESVPQRTIKCEETGNSKEQEMIHTTSCERAAITARSSSGYSSASCKAHGCMVSRDPNSKADRQSSQMKVHTPDMDEFIKSFRKVQPSPAVSFASTEKYSASKKCKRRNMSFSNEELQRIERENAILLNKIVLQQRSRPSVVHKYERRVTSHAINRARQLKKIECDNEILLKKIQDVKRKSTLSAQNSRCTSQASSSQI